MRFDGYPLTKNERKGPPLTYISVILKNFIVDVWGDGLRIVENAMETA